MKNIDEIEEQKKQLDQILFQQNKMASMGEMLDNIAHQWRQPLMELSSLFIPIEAKIKLHQELDQKEILEAISNLNDITKFMSKTIDDFRNFFAKDKEQVKFRISDQLNLSLNILATTLKKNDIQVDIIIKKNPILLGFKNEYAHVLINIINNAKDVLIERQVINPRIEILIEEYDTSNVVVSIEDNAGGINKEAMNKIFDPFFTHEKQNGTGLGLFMSKLIVENNMGGSLTAQNSTIGAKFIINIPKICQI